MLQDRYGLDLSTESAKARDAYVAGIDRFLAADIGVAEALDAAIAEDPDFVLAYLAQARNKQIIGDGRGARAGLKQAQKIARDLSPREDAHLAIMAALIEGKSSEGYRLARAHLVEYPRDILVAQACLGVFGLIGFSGLPGREAENLALAKTLAPSYGDDWAFLSTLGFAQVEAGQLGPGEQSLERSLSIAPRNANGAHYRSHLYYEVGDTEAGYAYLVDWMKDYPREALMHCHNNWHIGLWALARGDVDKMWAVVDAHVDPRNASGPPLNIMTDIAAILYRAELAGVEVSTERWQVVSDFGAKIFPRPGLAFADVHVALAHAMAGRGEDLERFVSDAKGPAADLVSVLGQAFGAIAKQDWAVACSMLTTAMSDHARIGGSRAQRDLLEYALAGVLMRMGQADEARRMLLMHRPMTATAGLVAGV